jgi:hypothetical protein
VRVKGLCKGLDFLLAESLVRLEVELLVLLALAYKLFSQLFMQFCLDLQIYFVPLLDCHVVWPLFKNVRRQCLRLLHQLILDGLGSGSH